MMRAGSLLVVSGGLAVGASAVAFGLAAQAAWMQGATASTLALAAPMGVAGLVALSLLGVPAPFRAATTPPPPPPLAAGEPRRDLAPPEARVGGQREQAAVGAAPVIGFAAFPVVSVADGRPVAAVAIEPAFRDSAGRSVGPDTVDWDRVPAAILARLDATLLARAAAFAGLYAEEGRRDTVMVAVAAASLGHRALAAQLGRLLDGAPGVRSQVMVLVRGDADDLDPYLRLPRAWRERLGLRLTAAPADEAALDRCLAVEPGCLELDASLLDEAARGAGLAGRLVARVAGAGVPVVVSGVHNDALLRRLRGHPALFARGPLFGGLAEAAA